MTKKSIIETMEEVSNRLSVIVIDKDDETKRGCHTSGLNLISAMQTIAELTKHGQKFIICIDVPYTTSWAIADYTDYQVDFAYWMGAYNSGGYLNSGRKVVK